MPRNSYSSGPVYNCLLNYKKICNKRKKIKSDIKLFQSACIKRHSDNETDV